MDKANKQVGPLSLDEFKQKGIMRETPVWREGMPNWVQAKDIPELHESHLLNHKSAWYRLS